MKRGISELDGISATFQKWEWVRAAFQQPASWLRQRAGTDFLRYLVEEQCVARDVAIARDADINHRCRRLELDAQLHDALRQLGVGVAVEQPHVMPRKDRAL